MEHARSVLLRGLRSPSRRARRYGAVSSADLLAFISDVDAIIDVILAGHVGTPEEESNTLRAVDSTFFEIDASAKFIDALAHAYSEAVSPSRSRLAAARLIVCIGERAPC